MDEGEFSENTTWNETGVLETIEGTWQIYFSDLRIARLMDNDPVAVVYKYEVNDTNLVLKQSNWRSEITFNFRKEEN